MEEGQTTTEQPATCTCTEKCVAGAVNTAVWLVPPIAAALAGAGTGNAGSNTRPEAIEQEPWVSIR